MSHDPYVAPSAQVSDQPSTFDVPPEVQKQIKAAWIAGVVSGTVTLAVSLLAISGTSVAGFTGWELVDVVLIYGLAYGIYRRNRACAVVMLIYFVVSKLLMMVEAGKPGGLLMAFIFGYYYTLGVQGTFRYHKMLRQHTSTAAAGA